MENEILKRIIYPKELCYQEVEPDDIVEHMLVNIKEAIPNWIEIKIDKIDNNF